MSRLYKRPACVASALLVPLFTLWSPTWLSFTGVAPCWSIFWLLPWALVDGPMSGVLAGMSLGLILDGISIGGPSQIPALVILGWWWGRLGKSGAPVERSLNIGLLAWLGTIFLGLTIALQTFFIGQNDSSSVLSIWIWQNLLIESFLTGLFAPFIASWGLLQWRQQRF